MTVRTRVINHGGIDTKFIGLAACVVVLSAGAAIAGPSLISMMGGNSVRPIKEVIAGLDRQEIRAALAHEAFPDQHGRAFMTSLATHFPQQHGRLLDQLADTASAGGDRNDLIASVNAWSMEFAPQQLAALGRTGAEGFDAGVAILDDAMKVIESEAGGCTMKKLEAYLRNPESFADISRYGSPGYNLGMRSGARMIELVAKGRNAPPVSTQITADDEMALRSTFISLLSDPQVMSMIQASAAGPAGPGLDFQQNINVCQFARTIIIKLEGLPKGTKSRLFAAALSGGNLLDGSLASPFGPRFGPPGSTEASPFGAIPAGLLP